MSVKTVAFTNVANLRYPFIAIDRETDLIVLLSGPGEGTCLQGGSTKYIAGYYTDNWIMKRLVPYYGKVTLENE